MDNNPQPQLSHSRRVKIVELCRTIGYETVAGAMSNNGKMTVDQALNWLLEQGE